MRRQRHRPTKQDLCQKIGTCFLCGIVDNVTQNTKQSNQYG
jgi:hypothetical protein